MRELEKACTPVIGPRRFVSLPAVTKSLTVEVCPKKQLAISN